MLGVGTTSWPNRSASALSHRSPRGKASSSSAVTSFGARHSTDTASSGSQAAFFSLWQSSTGVQLSAFAACITAGVASAQKAFPCSFRKPLIRNFSTELLFISDDSAPGQATPSFTSVRKGASAHAAQCRAEVPVVSMPPASGCIASVRASSGLSSSSCSTASNSLDAQHRCRSFGWEAVVDGLPSPKEGARRL